MNNINIFKTLFLSLALCGAASAYAVTDQEMEEARAITAKAYLRFVNDGSGYLDDVKASSIAQLKKSLKKKETENITAFLNIKAPSDYASWDKEKLTSYWVSVLDNKTLIEKGKAAKGRVRKQIGAMTLSAPKAKEESKTEAKTEIKEPATPAPLPSDSSALASGVTAEETPADATDQDILADQKAVAQDIQTPSLEKEENSTWIYILILCILLGVVVWLVAYAARLMKKQESSSDDADAIRESARKVIAQQKEQIAALQKELSRKSEIAEGSVAISTADKDAINHLNRRLADEQERNAEAARTIERLKLDNKRLSEQVEQLRMELRSRPETQHATVDPGKRPSKESDILRVIYLGRANSRGIFVRADRRINPGNTVYRLDTNDGLVGTFQVVNLPEVVETVLTRPEEMLAGGCNGMDFGDAIGATSIVTESNGTAILENGYWKVLRKARIRFE